MSAASALKGKLLLLGAGKMGGALLEGWLNSALPAGRIVVRDPAPPPEVRALIAKHRIELNPDSEKLKDIEVLLVAVKPQALAEVLSGLGPIGPPAPLVISVVAGKTIAAFQRHFGTETPVVRSIPNTPAAIGRGITAIAFNSHVSDSQKRLARSLLEAVGEVVTVDDETLIDVATAVSGSGPAYVFHLVECLAEAGAKAGLPRELAVRLARATVAGAGELMVRSGLPAAILRENVTSPKGTTHAALEVLMAPDGLAPLFEKAVAAAARRSRELAS